MDQFLDRLGHQVIATVVFAAVGLVLFGLCFVVLGKVVKFPIRKEIEEDQNVAVAILIGSAMIAFALIVSAAVRE